MATRALESDLQADYLHWRGAVATFTHFRGFLPVLTGRKEKGRDE